MPMIVDRVLSCVVTCNTYKSRQRRQKNPAKPNPLDEYAKIMNVGLEGAKPEN